MSFDQSGRDEDTKRTREMIFAAADECEEEKPGSASVRKVRAKLGGGGSQNLTDTMREWRRERRRSKQPPEENEGRGEKTEDPVEATEATVGPQVASFMKELLAAVAADRKDAVGKVREQAAADIKSISEAAQRRVTALADKHERELRDKEDDAAFEARSVDELTEALDEAERERDELKSQHSELRDVLDAERKQAREARERLSGIVAEQQTTIADISRQLDRAGEQLAKERDEARELSNLFRQEREDGQKRSDTLRSERDEALDELAAAKRLVGKLKARVSEAEEERDNTEAELAEAKRKLNGEERRNEVLQSVLATQAYHAAPPKPEIPSNDGTWLPMDYRLGNNVAADTGNS